MNKKKGSKRPNISFVEMANYERPEVIETAKDDYISYGSDNNYYGEIIERYLGSPTNSRCINGISDMIFGRGLDAIDRNINIDSYIEMKKLIDEGRAKKDCWR